MSILITFGLACLIVSYHRSSNLDIGQIVIIFLFLKCLDFFWKFLHLTCSSFSFSFLYRFQFDLDFEIDFLGMYGVDVIGEGCFVIVLVWRDNNLLFLADELFYNHF